MRTALLEDPSRAAHEAELRLDDLARAQRIVMMNVMLGAVDARLGYANRMPRSGIWSSRHSGS